MRSDAACSRRACPPRRSRRGRRTRRSRWAARRAPSLTCSRTATRTTCSPSRRRSAPREASASGTGGSLEGVPAVTLPWARSAARQRLWSRRARAHPTFVQGARASHAEAGLAGRTNVHLDQWVLTAQCVTRGLSYIESVQQKSPKKGKQTRLSTQLDMARLRPAQRAHAQAHLVDQAHRAGGRALEQRGAIAQRAQLAARARALARLAQVVPRARGGAVRDAERDKGAADPKAERDDAARQQRLRLEERAVQRERTGGDAMECCTDRALRLALVLLRDDQRRRRHEGGRAREGEGDEEQRRVEEGGVHEGEVEAEQAAQHHRRRDRKVPADAHQALQPRAERERDNHRWQQRERNVPETLLRPAVHDDQPAAHDRPRREATHAEARDDDHVAQHRLRDNAQSLGEAKTGVCGRRGLGRLVRLARTLCGEAREARVRLGEGKAAGEERGRAKRETEPNQRIVVDVPPDDRVVCEQAGRRSDEHLDDEDEREARRSHVGRAHVGDLRVRDRVRVPERTRERA
mmetsp:Transcript_5976/g.18765  ORF Transcript_5976/g.18765 Transcript_5976/m.18765 type:complete len:521 (+) Transcript_5976:1061-2623(+)